MIEKVRNPLIFMGVLNRGKVALLPVLLLQLFRVIYIS